MCTPTITYILTTYILITVVIVIIISTTSQLPPTSPTLVFVRYLVDKKAYEYLLLTLCNASQSSVFTINHKRIHIRRETRHFRYRPLNGFLLNKA